MRVGHHDVLADGGLEGADTGMHASAQLTLRQQWEPALHQIEPGGAGWREVDM